MAIALTPPPDDNDGLPDDDNPPVCRDCGALVPAFELAQRRLKSAYQSLDQKERENGELGEAVVRTQRQLSNARGTIRQLREQQSKEDDEFVVEAKEAAEYWKRLLAPKTRELKGPRLEKTVARRKAGYTLDELKLAIYGYYCRPYVVDGKRKHTGKPQERHVDLELIMRDAKHVDTGMAIARHDANLDIDRVHDGGTLRQAALCDCGHARADHMRTDLVYKFLVERFGEEQGQKMWFDKSEPCAHSGCDCVTYDNVNRLVNERLAREKIAPVPPPRPDDKAA